MRKMPKYSHLFNSQSNVRFNEYKTAVCGAHTKNMFAAHITEAAKLAAFSEQHAWVPPLCPKCAAAALLHEVTEAARA